MAWMDNLTRKISQTEGVTGRGISPNAVSAATSAGLQSDYDMAFKSAQSERTMRMKQKELDQQNAQFATTAQLGRDTLNANIASDNARLAQQNSQFNRNYALAENAQDINSTGNIAKAALTYGKPAMSAIGGISDMASSAYDKIFGGSGEITPMDYGAQEAVSGLTSEAIGEAISSPSLSGWGGAATIGGEALSYAGGAGLAEALSYEAGSGFASLGTTASEAVAFWTTAGQASAAAMAMGAESVVSGIAMNYVPGVVSAMEGMGIATAATEVGSAMAGISGAISSVGAYVPYIGPVLMATSFLAPELMADVYGIVGDVGDALLGGLDAAGEFVGDIGGIAGDFMGDAFDVVGDAFDTAVDVMSFGGSVICTELNRQGRLSDELYKIESSYGSTVPEDSLFGYRLWAKHVVNVMQKSELVTNIVEFMVAPVIEEMSHRVEPERKGSLIGSLILKIGTPLCGFIWRHRKIEQELVRC